MATGDSTVRSTGKIAMRHTDHDAWLVVLSMPTGEARRRPTSVVPGTGA